MSRGGRRALLIGGALGLVAATAHSAAWLLVTSRIVQGLPRVQAEAAASDWRLEWTGAQRAGWPLAATVQLIDAEATRPLGGTVLRWRVPRLDVTIAPSDLRHLHLEPVGDQLLEASEHSFAIRAAGATMLVPLDGAEPMRLRLSHAELATAGNRVSAGLLDAKFDAVAIDAHLSSIQAVPPMPPPFDGGADLTLRAAIDPALPLAPTPGQSAAQWQAAGGKLMLDTIDLDWGPVHLRGRGEGGLDLVLQPAGTAALTIEGALQIVDALGRGGLIAPGHLSATRAVLSLLALGSQGRPLHLPITLRDRRLVVAQFPIARFPELRWDPP